MTQFRLIILFSLLFTHSCSDRERLNPLDPENPLTHGVPTGITAVTNRDSITLRWNPIVVDDLIEYEVFKGADGSDLLAWVQIGSDFNSFMTHGLTYDMQYNFAIKAITAFTVSELSNTISVIPGPVNIWVADIYYSGLKLLTYDGTYSIKQRDFTSIQAISYDSVEKILWAADYWEQKLYSYTTDLVEKTSIQLASYPIDIAIDKTENIIYVVLRNNFVKGFTYQGAETFSMELSKSTSRIAFDTINSSLWLTIDHNNMVYQIRVDSTNNSVVEHESIYDPGAVEADPIYGGVWLATDRGIVKIHGSGWRINYKEEYSIYDLSINNQNGDCYYVGRSRDTNQWEAGRLDYVNPQQSEIILDQDYDHLYDIQVVPGTGSPGIIVRQASSSKLLRFTATGQKIGEITEFESFVDFALE